MATQQFNDPHCRRGDDPAHRCTDKFGDHFASPLREPRPGSMCWWETMQRLEEDRAAAHAEIDAAFAAFVDGIGRVVTLDDLMTSRVDVDFRESPEVR